MTNPWDSALEAYRQYPMDDGEVVLLLPDEAVCLELGALPDDDALPDHAAAVASQVHSATAVLAVARHGRRPQPVDLLLWTELWSALGSGTELLPLQVLPAAA